MCAYGKAIEPDVVGGHLQGVGQAAAAGDEGGVGVLHALGVRGRARGGVDPPHRLLAVRVLRRRRQRRRITLGEAVDAQHRGGRVHLRRQAVGHRRVVEALPGAGHDDELRAGVAHDEAQLLLPVQVQHRALHGVQTGQRRGDHDRVDPGRELPGDQRAGADAELGEARRHALGAVAELAVGDPRVLPDPVALGDEHGAVGCLGRAFVDEVPDRCHDPKASPRPRSRASLRRRGS